MTAAGAATLALQHTDWRMPGHDRMESKVYNESPVGARLLRGKGQGPQRAQRPHGPPRGGVPEQPHRRQPQRHPHHQQDRQRGAVQLHTRQGLKLGL